MTPELRRACVRSSHVITRDGQILNAGRATIFILRELGWRGLWVLSVPPLVWPVELGYAVFSRNRSIFFPFLIRLMSLDQADE